MRLHWRGPDATRSRRDRASWASRVVNAIPAPLLGNPFEIFVGALCVISGLPSLFTGPPAASLEALLPSPLVRLWGAELVVGGLLIVIGVVIEHHRVERLGLMQLGPAAVAYGLAIVFVVGVGGIAAAGVLIAFGLACLARSVVLLAAARMRSELLAVAAEWAKFPPDGP